MINDNKSLMIKFQLFVGLGGNVSVCLFRFFRPNDSFHWILASPKCLKCAPMNFLWTGVIQKKVF